MSKAAAKKQTTIAEARAVRIRGHRVGRVVGWLDDVTPLVEFAGNPHGAQPARVLDASIRAPAREQAEVLLTFESEQSNRPIVVGFLSPGRSLTPAAPAESTTLDAVVDGKRVVIEGEDEIVFKCGLASVTLRRNGRVVIRGTYVETRATGVNRIRGGTVEIN